MALFGVGKVCVFSDVQMRITQNGEPLSGVEVVRSWEWNKRQSDSATTNAKGVVQFPSVHESSASRLFPAELIVGQQLAVKVDGKEIVVFTNAKREPEINAEFGGKAFVVHCELNNEERLIEDYGSLMVTICDLEDQPWQDDT